MKNIIFELNNNKKISVTEEEFETLNLSEKLADNTTQFVDLGKRGFQKYSLVSWDIENPTTESGVPVQ